MRSISAVELNRVPQVSSAAADETWEIANLRNLIRRTRRLSRRKGTLAALAVPPQVFPRIDTAGMPVEPIELQRIAPNRNHA